MTTIPPFPSQDLAKLVLGYLAEEQLMTAYDEFLQASPYLDALRNEYDRIFMTSLKNILAEYRAVKIFVETCKPVVLRRRLFGCVNLLEVVKFLVQNIDVNKLHVQDIIDRNSSEKVNTTNLSKLSGCEVCTSLKLSNCICKNKSTDTISTHSSNLTAVPNLDSSVETTALEDLPGHHVTTRKKHVKILGQEKISESTLSTEQNIELNSKQPDTLCVISDKNIPKDIPSSENISDEHNSVLQGQDILPIKSTSTVKSIQKLEEFDDVMNTVNSNSTAASQINTSSEFIENQLPVASTFQEFATGVHVNSDNDHTTVPDSCILENLSRQIPVIKETSMTDKNPRNRKGMKGVTKAHILLKVENVKSNSVSHLNNEALNVGDTSNDPCMRYTGLSKPNEQRVTILSDIKVDKSFNKNDSCDKIPPVLKNATSTPLMQMQTIVINGTPAYRRDRQFSQVGQVCNYTKDEIMAMPTIILVPTSTSGLPSVTASIQSKSIPTEVINPLASSITPSTTQDSTTQGLGPLKIDVSLNNPLVSNDINTGNLESSTLNSQNEVNENTMLMKTVDARNPNHQSVPKDNVIETSNKSTPQALPPVRKSSSTPRRNSHVRVLDFTTPRRILQETIIEHVTNQNCDCPEEEIISKSPNLHTFVNIPNCEIIPSNNTPDVKLDCSNNKSGCTKENILKEELLQIKRYNWDSSLRALAVANDLDNKSPIKPKPKAKIPRKKKTISEEQEGNKAKTHSKKKSNTKSKNKMNRNNQLCAEVSEEPIVVVDDPVTTPVIPTINIIPGNNWGTSTHNNDRSLNKSNVEDQADTPEMDRISLQNAIGAKLNISDLLETPYKQALYDIQMETPRFLGPDLPGEPLSDIKIMNIPTPKFFNSPKPVQTPSSYSSRPTDYSSGGSYYKPDDQDYLPLDLEYPTAPQIEPKTNSVLSGNIDNKEKVKLSRPVRKCTKNVSYYSSPIVNKTKEDDKIEATSSCSETVNVNSLCGNKKDSTKLSKENKSRAQIKSEARKKNAITKKRKSPIKKETPKTFMKIKPRRPTPIKDPGRVRKKTPHSQVRKTSNSKEKSMNITPLLISAPTKSRRKSSTPRKLHCTKTFNSESSGHDSPDMIVKNKQISTRDSRLSCAPDSDTEQLPLRWSDDGSQDAKSTEPHINISVNESDDILRIQEYIAKTESIKLISTESNLHEDLVKRGFDIETAKIIERDLLDTPPYPKDNCTRTIHSEGAEVKKVDTVEKLAERKIQSDGGASINIEEDDCVDEIELSVHECNEDTDNYIICCHDDTTHIPERFVEKLKDKFSMEVCIDDDLSIRLRTTPCTMLIDQYPEDMVDYNYRETEMAVNSISNIQKLYTPLKDTLKAQCYDIFDSTLTSLDTPLKVSSPRRKEHEISVTEIVLEVEKVEVKQRLEVQQELEITDRVDVKKRKRLQSGNASDDSTSENKRAKPESQYMLNSANIQNIDIETVLYKLHGP